WLRSLGYFQSSVMVPTGTAWPNTLKLVRERISDFIPHDTQLALGLVEDWANLVNLANLTPDGYEDAAAITFTLLSSSNEYGDKNRKRIFAVLAKVPAGKKDSFVDLLRRGGSDEREEFVAREFADYLLEGSQSIYVTKAYPDDVIDLTRRRLCLPENYEPDPYGGDRLDIGRFFGMESDLKFFPPSAIRCPFHALLQWNFRKGIEFVVELVNHSVDYYARPRMPDRLEPAWEVELKLPEGTVKKQWHNPRLWQLYRGTSVGPNALMCALMATEDFFLR